MVMWQAMQLCYVGSEQSCNFNIYTYVFLLDNVIITKAT